MFAILRGVVSASLDANAFNLRVLALHARKHALSAVILSHRDRLRALGFTIDDSDEITHTFSRRDAGGQDVDELLFYRDLLAIKIRDSERHLISNPMVR